MAECYWSDDVSSYCMAITRKTPNRAWVRATCLKKRSLGQTSRHSKVKLSFLRGNSLKFKALAALKPTYLFISCKIIPCFLPLAIKLVMMTPIGWKDFLGVGEKDLWLPESLNKIWVRQVQRLLMGNKSFT